MLTIRTDRGFEFARAEARKQMQSALISVVLFVNGEPTMRDYVFRSGSAR